MAAQGRRSEAYEGGPDGIWGKTVDTKGNTTEGKRLDPHCCPFRWTCDRSQKEDKEEGKKEKN